jgi:beta-lactamase regulating signal transducer with metallopeptidase domain
MIALSLGLSIAVAAIGGLAARLLQRLSPDPRLRERAWSLALWAPALAPVAVALLLFSPAPVREIAPAPVAPLVTEVLPAALMAAPVAERGLIVDGSLAAPGLLALAGVLSAARLIALAVRTARLHGLVRMAEAAPRSLIEAIHTVADDMWVRAPVVRVSPTAAEALLAGLVRPVLILPAALAGQEETPDARAVFAHELAHLKRRDHHALWLEEILLAVLAVNPVLPLLRRARAAAREEACDALALAGAAPDVRRAYARTLIEALKRRADASEPGGVAPPALTFTGAQRTFAMSRLKAVLDPAPAAGRRARLTVLGAAALILGLAGGGAFAVAAQRSPQLVSTDEAAALPVTARDSAWLNAALNPVYKAAWPQACGFGSTSDGAVFVQIGKGCTTDAVADPVIESLAFVDPSKSPRDAFAAVKAACDAGLEVPIRFRQGGVRAGTSVRCAAPAVRPPEPTAFEVRLTWRDVTPQPGDRLVVSLERKVGETTFRRALDFGLTEAGALPASVRARVQPEFFEGRHSPAMKTALVGRDGRIRAVSADHATPMRISDGAAVGYALLSPTDTPQAAAAEASQTSARAALASLTPEQRARYANPTGEQYKALCRSSEVGDEGFCSGVLFAQLPDRSSQQTEICAPAQADDYDVARIAREGRRAVARVRVSSGMTATAVAREALKVAYPCPTGVVYLIDGRPMPDGMPGWAVSTAQVLIRPPARGRQQVWDWTAPQSTGSRLRIDGRLMPVGFGVNNLYPYAVRSQSANAAGEVEVTLKTYEEFQATVAANRASRPAT